MVNLINALFHLPNNFILCSGSPLFAYVFRHIVEQEPGVTAVRDLAIVKADFKRNQEKLEAWSKELNELLEAVNNWDVNCFHLLVNVHNIQRKYM